VGSWARGKRASDSILIRFFYPQLAKPSADCNERDFIK